MIKITTIFFLSVYLLGNTEVGQLINLPSLVKHYRFHHQIDKRIDLMSFLVKHYCTNDGISGDDKDDNQLPFRQLHNPFSMLLMEMPVNASFYSNIIIAEPSKNTHFKKSDLLTGFYNLLLQPPETIS